MEKTILALTVAVAFTGCASLLNGGKQTVRISSNVEGATIYVDGQTYVTPAVVNLKGKISYDVRLEKEGYDQAYGKINSDMRLGSGIFGNLVNFSTFIGMAVDFIGTGAGWALKDDVYIEMQEKPVSMASGEQEKQQ